jgi:hypothetical protein
MTAFGTVGAVIAALGIALWSERRTDKRLVAERTHSDKQLADERAFSRAQIEEERQAAHEREQFSEAYSVQVVAGERSIAPGEIPRAPASVAALVVNHGRYTITRIEAQVRLTAGGNASLVPFRVAMLMPGAKELDARLAARLDVVRGTAGLDRLTPWDLGLRFESDPIAAESDAHPVVRWADRWGTRWEHRRGVVRQVRDGEEWVP